MAARKRRVKLTDEWKQKIGAGVIMQRLVKHVNGKLDLSPTQVRAADILLKKVIPDLAKTEHTGLDEGPIKYENINVNDPEAVSRRIKDILGMPT